MFVEDILLGLSPFTFLCFSDAVTEVLYVTFITLPSQTIFAKMIPSTIESSMFSITTGLINFANLFASKQLGNLFNWYFEVEKENLDELWKLYVVQCVMSVVPIVFLWLLPTRKEVEKVQKVIEFMEKEESGLIVEGEREINIKELDPNVALRMGVQSNPPTAESNS